MARTKQTIAHSLVSKALKDGTLKKPGACQQCGNDKVRIVAHHPDYDKPLDVEWLCDPCHGKTAPSINGEYPEDGQTMVRIPWDLWQQIKELAKKSEPRVSASALTEFLIESQVKEIEKQLGIQDEPLPDRVSK